MNNWRACSQFPEKKRKTVAVTVRSPPQTPASPSLQCSRWVKEDRWGVHHPCRKDKGTFKSAGSIVQWRSAVRWTWNRATLGRVIIAHHGWGFWFAAIYLILPSSTSASAHDEATPSKSGTAESPKTNLKVDENDLRSTAGETRVVRVDELNAHTHP